MGVGEMVTCQPIEAQTEHATDQSERRRIRVLYGGGTFVRSGPNGQIRPVARPDASIQKFPRSPWHPMIFWQATEACQPCHTSMIYKGVGVMRINQPITAQTERATGRSEHRRICAFCGGGKFVQSGLIGAFLSPHEQHLILRQNRCRKHSSS